MKIQMKDKNKRLLKDVLDLVTGCYHHFQQFPSCIVTTWLIGSGRPGQIYQTDRLNICFRYFTYHTNGKWKMSMNLNTWNIYIHWQINLFSPWYSWKITWSVLKVGVKQQSLTHSQIYATLNKEQHPAIKLVLNTFNKASWKRSLVLKIEQWLVETSVWFKILIPWENIKMVELMAIKLLGW